MFANGSDLWVFAGDALELADIKKVGRTHFRKIPQAVAELGPQARQSFKKNSEITRDPRVRKRFYPKYF